MSKIKVGIVGYGTIGKRVADAVMLQDDMELIGVTGNSYNFRIHSANKKNIPIFLMGDNEDDFTKNNVKPSGKIDDLLKKVDVIVDCTPKNGEQLKQKYYEPAGVKVIFQGGEKEGVSECSFNASVNYDEALNKQFVRVVSCNTTGLCRTLYPLKKYGIKKVRVTLIRRASDPGESKKGPINGIAPTLTIPSHHGPDVKTVIKGLDISSIAFVASTTLMHVHSVSVELENQATTEEVIELWKQNPRVLILKDDDKIKSTAELMEYAKDLGFSRGDMMKICVWEKGIGFDGTELVYMQAVHQESDVVPENIDAIRAVMGFKDAEKSIKITNKSLDLE